MAEFKPTAAQNAAAEDHGGAVLVSAAAGSGKTRVLVDRLMRQICDPVQPHDVDEFLIITFTKKAAAELRGRIAKELAKRLSENPRHRHLQRQLHRIYLANISTVDAFCGTLVREYAYQLRLPADFRQAEESELAAVSQKLVSALLDDAYTDEAAAQELRQLAELLGAKRSDDSVAALIIDTYSEARSHLSEDEWIEFCRRSADVSGLNDASQTVWGRYLIDRMHTVVSGFLCDYEKLLPALAADTKLAAGYLPAFSADAALLRQLAAADTWDAVSAFYPPVFEGLNAVRKCAVPELQAQAKLIRDLLRGKLPALLSAFASPSAEVFAEAERTSPALQRLFTLVQEFGKRYAAEKERLHILDFADLEHGALRLLLQKGTRLPTKIAAEISSRFTEIMVDEYQDTNEVQDAIFRAISKNGQNRFMVGDVKQSVYRFRLADPTIFLKKYETYRDYQDALPGEPRRILLSENFRSGGEVLEAANAVFRACMSKEVGELDYGENEALREGIPHPALPYRPVELLCTDLAQNREKKDAAEAIAVAARIRRLLDEKTPIRDGDTLRPVYPGDIAILLRTLKGQVQYYLQALSAQGISAVCETGDNFLCSEELEDLFSLLQVLDNAHQDIPLTAALLSPLFGFTAEALARIRAAHPYGDLYDAVAHAATTDAQCREFLEAIHTLRAAAQELPVHALIEKINTVTQMDAVFGAMPDGKLRCANLRRLSELAGVFESGGHQTLREFIVYLDALRQTGSTLEPAVSQNSVTLLSIHKSKGLEYPVVVLAGLSRSFNLRDLTDAVLLHPQFGAASNICEPETKVRYASSAKKAIAAKLRAETLSEEIRLLYVAMTRPQDMLIMSVCGTYLKKRITDLATRLCISDSRRIAADADSMGDWVLIAALQRLEAGALFSYAGVQPDCARLSDLPWSIQLLEGIPELPEQDIDVQAPDAAAAPDLRMLSFRYPAPLATQVPSKITATQLKGRDLDEEVADGLPAPSVHLRQPPLFASERPLTPAEQGTATHLAMQYLDFAKAGSEAEIAQELERMVDGAFLTRKQADAVSPATLYRVFCGPLGEMIRSADEVIREFKFSIMTDADAYFPAESGEQILLQGVTDCCLVKNGKLTVIDFKTDNLRPGGEQAAAAQYRPQLEAYCLALSRIFGMPVEAGYLYFFRTNRLVAVECSRA